VATTNEASEYVCELTDATIEQLKAVEMMNDQIVIQQKTCIRGIPK